MSETKGSWFPIPSLSSKTNKSNTTLPRLGRIEKRILLTLLANGNKSMRVLTIYSFSLNINSDLPIPLGSYLSGCYAQAQWYQALEKLYGQRLIEVDSSERVRRFLLTQNGLERAREIYEKLLGETQQWLPYLITIKKRLESESTEPQP